jgi:hypothetical protein
MIDTYILYNNTDHSRRLVEDCRLSLHELGNVDSFNLIPVLGYRTDDAVALYKRLGFKIISYYIDLLNSPITSEFRKELNGALCATAGHVKIWRRIVKSGKPSIVLEHDAIFKTLDFNLDELEDFMIYWLGPRTAKLEDYQFPLGETITFSEKMRFEGVHAYAITPTTAEYLINQWDCNGFTDSIDGALAMRNWYDLTMVVLDPPPVVAVVDRDGKNTSTIESAPAIWNAENTPGFLRGLKTAPPVERIVEFDNSKLIKNFPVMFLTEPAKILAIVNDDGTALKVLSNQLLEHEDNSSIEYICPKDNVNTNKFKSYFSHFYYKIRHLGVTQQEYTILTKDFLDVLNLNKYNMIYMDCYHLDFVDTLYNTLKILDKHYRCLILFNKEEDKFLEVLKCMNYTLKVIGNLVLVEKHF